MENITPGDVQGNISNTKKAKAAALATAEEAFNILDLDGNGELERAEVEQLLAQTQSTGLPCTDDPAARESKISEFFASFDANADGKIQKSEWLNFFANLFDSFVEQQQLAEPQ